MAADRSALPAAPPRSSGRRAAPVRSSPGPPRARGGDGARGRFAERDPAPATPPAVAPNTSRWSSSSTLCGSCATTAASRTSRCGRLASSLSAATGTTECPSPTRSSPLPRPRMAALPCSTATRTSTASPRSSPSKASNPPLGEHTAMARDSSVARGVGRLSVGTAARMHGDHIDYPFAVATAEDHPPTSDTQSPEALTSAKALHVAGGQGADRGSYSVAGRPVESTQCLQRGGADLDPPALGFTQCEAPGQPPTTRCRARRAPRGPLPRPRG